MSAVDIGIDLGTANALVYVKDKGIVIDEPTVVAYEKDSKEIIAIGSKAKAMLGRVPSSIEVVRPLKQGVISDYTVCEQMLKAFIKKAMSRRRFFSKPRVCICVPSGVNEVERRAFEDTAYSTGAKDVQIMEEPVAAAIGANIDISKASGNMVVDIGGGTSDVAVISLGGIVINDSLKIAGDDFNDALIKYVRRKYNLLIGETTAEDTKKEIGSVIQRKEPVEKEIKGRNLINGLPARVTITSDDTAEAFSEVTAQILDTIHNVLELTPPELLADISKKGIVLSGGGSLIYGFDKIVEHSTGIPAYVVDTALQGVALGAGKAQFLS